VTLEIKIESTSNGSYCHWHINHVARRNAIGTTLARQLFQGLEALKSDESLRAVVITAEPSGSDGIYWIAGGDLKELALLDSQSALEYASLMRRICEGLHLLPIPVLMGLDGAAIGGGAEFFLAGDIRLATKRSSLFFKQLDVGLPTGYGGSKRLVELVGLGKAQELLYLRRTVDAGNARSLGLVHEVTDDMKPTLESLLSVPSEVFAVQKRMLTEPSRTNEWMDIEFAKVWKNPKHEATLDKFK
jgi:enoyl-CoA hydratase/carnithine racemase